MMRNVPASQPVPPNAPGRPSMPAPTIVLVRFTTPLAIVDPFLDFDTTTTDDDDGSSSALLVDGNVDDDAPPPFLSTTLPYIRLMDSPAIFDSSSTSTHRDIDIGEAEIQRVVLTDRAYGVLCTRDRVARRLSSLYFVIARHLSRSFSHPASALFSLSPPTDSFLSREARTT
jgi:hypothetical protein